MGLFLVVIACHCHCADDYDEETYQRYRSPSVKKSLYRASAQQPGHHEYDPY